MKRKTFICNCHSLEHQIHIEYDPEGYPNDNLYFSIFLSSNSFWKRVWLAVKYIFGYKTEYGHFETVFLKEEDKRKIIDLIQESLAESINCEYAPSDKVFDQEINDFIKARRVRAEETKDLNIGTYKTRHAEKE